MQVVDLVRDGLNDTMPEFGEETNRGESVTDAWDFVQENVSQWCVVIHSGAIEFIPPALLGRVCTFPSVLCFGANPSDSAQLAIHN